MKFKRESKPNPLKDWYDQLHNYQVKPVKNEIINKCGVHRATFNNWVLGVYQVPNAAKIVINIIAEKDVFPIEKPITISQLCQN